MARRAGTIRGILVATDLQSDSRAVIELAGSIAAAADAAVHLIHVMESAGDGRSPAAAALREQQAADARRGLDAQAAALKEAGARVESVIRAKGGPAHRKIMKRVEETDADLVVLGSHVRKGTGHRLGSTADRVLRTSAVPCLIVRGTPRFPFRTVAAMMDFSPPARKALRLAVAWLHALDGEEDPPAVEIVHVGDAQLRALDASVEGLLQTQLDREHDRVRKGAGPGAAVSTRLLWGRYPAEELIAAARDGDHDLLVLGTHGKGPVVRALVGSVALAVTQSAPCPVLVVPPGS